MEIEYSGIDESLVKWRYNTEPWHTAYITDLIAYWESDKAKENTYVKYMSTVAVRPVVYGEWIERNVTQDRRDAKISEWQSAKCSLCGKYHTTPYMYYFTNYNYCPNCGAKMDESEEKDG